MSHCLPVGGSVRVENEVRVAGFPGSQTINITNTSEAITTRQRHFRSVSYSAFFREQDQESYCLSRDLAKTGSLQPQ
jgi:hypothetical protein